MNVLVKRIMIVSLLLLSVVFAPTVHADFAALGPIDPANGFPAFIQDSTGLSLGLCLDQNAFCVLTPPFDPAITNPPALITTGPASAITSTNFPDENFLWLADALLNIGTTGAAKASFRLATEGAFGAAVQNGQQIMFHRVNLRVAAVPGDLPPNSTYTVTYPFGSFTFDTDATGIPIKQAGVTARFEDGCFAAVCLTDPATMLATPFTHFTAFLGCAAGGPFADPVTGHRYIGNPAAPCTLQAGPLGNFFRIAGPDAGGPGVLSVQTAQWTVAGKIVGMLASPASVAFATQRPTITTASPVITITNPDITAAATLGPATITGPDAADFTIASGSTCTGGAILGINGGTCTFTVNFSEPAPGLFGPKSAIVSFPVTTPLNKPAVVVNLSGAIDNQLPTIVSTVPGNNDANAPANNAITATFSEPVTGVSATTFTLTTAASGTIPGTAVDGTVTYNASSNTAVFTPAANLVVNGNFTATIVGGAAGITDLAGNALLQDFVFSFKTTLPDTTPPAVLSSSPENNALGVPTKTTVAVVFNEPVDPATVNESTFTLATPGGVVTGTVTYDTLARTATFAPSKDLANDQLHTATVTTGVKSLGGIPMTAAFTLTFVTNAAPTAPQLISPADGQTGVGPSVDFQWIKSRDSNGDNLTYHLYYCTNRFMVNCNPVDVVAQSSSLRNTLAGLGGYGAGILLAGFLIAGGVKSRRKLFFLITVLLISGMAATACKKSGSDNGTSVVGVDPATVLTKSISGLSPASQYYWKVVVDDGKGALVESETRSFTTQ
jgi:Big-like domain-containing protein